MELRQAWIDENTHQLHIIDLNGIHSIYEKVQGNIEVIKNDNKPNGLKNDNQLPLIFSDD